MGNLKQSWDTPEVPQPRVAHARRGTPVRDCNLLRTQAGAEEMNKKKASGEGRKKK